MKEQKTEYLSKLYLLRSMLSKISGIKDDYHKIEQSIDDVHGRKFFPSICVTDDNNDEELYKEKIALLEGKLSKINEQEKQVRAKICEREADYEKRNRPWKASDRFWGILWGGVSSIVIYFLMKWWLNTGCSFWVGLISFPISLVFLFFGIIGITVYTPKGHKSDLQTRKADIEKEYKIKAELNEQRKTLEGEILAVKAEAKKLKDKEEIKISIDKLIEKEYEDFECSKIRQIRELRQSRELLINEADIIYDIIKNKSESLLDERDWQNLDLIIYELETGRADTIKEALQQADLYIRHEEIRGMMETATSAICSTIKESIGELSRSIGISLTNLRADIFEMNQTNRELASELATKFDELVDAQEFSNALLKKANVSSEQLAEDVRRMRNLRDEEYYKT